MKNFEILQNQLQDYLMFGNPDIIQHIVHSHRVSSESRLEVYSNAYRLRLQDALKTSYTALHAYMGDDLFEELLNEYIDQYPSSYKSIRWFGDKFHHHIKAHPGYQHAPYLAELALFEWTCSLVFDASDAPALTLEEMAAIPPHAWPNLRFEFHPTVHRLLLSWNVVQIWQELNDESDPSDPSCSDEPVTWMLWRRGLMTQFRSLEVDEAWAINALFEGADFSQICEGLCRWNTQEQAGQRAASLLQSWIVSGFIAKMKGSHGQPEGGDGGASKKNLTFQNSIVLSLALTAALASIGTNTNWFSSESSTVISRDRCYGVAATGQNDCANTKHSCAGQSTQNAATDEFIMLPRGLCERIVGGREV